MLSLIDPFHVVREEVKDSFERIFESSFLDKESSSSDFYPAINLFEDDAHFIVTAELPGVNKGDFKLTVQGRKFSIEGELKGLDRKNINAIREERPRGKFTRSLELTKKIDENNVSAEYQDGVLIVKLAKAEESKPKLIAVK